MSNNERAKDLVLVTGASGFVAKHTIHQLLQAGYRIRGTVRNEGEAAIVRSAFDLDAVPLTLVTVDLMSDNGWEDAVQDSRFVLHIASPYPLGAAPNKDEIIAIAKEGSLRVVKAALQQSTVEHVVVVSSIYAMMYPKKRPSTARFWGSGTVEQALTEESWTDVTNRTLTGYPLSKAIAERVVWDFAHQHGATDKVTVVNPAMVWGPMFDNVLSTSSEIATLFFDGLYPAAPATKYPIVDVRDVALLMVQILRTTDGNAEAAASTNTGGLGGRRLLACGGSLSFIEMGNVLGKAFPTLAYKMPRYIMPKWLFYLCSSFDRNLLPALPDLGYDYKADSTYVSELVSGVTFRPATEAVYAMGQSLVEQGILSEKDPSSTATPTKRATMVATTCAFLLVGMLVIGNCHRRK